MSEAGPAEARPASDVWDRFLQAQADLVLPFELPFYYEDRGWREAREVLDLGTGNGAYLNALRLRFPDKRYRGIDRDQDLIARARARYAAEGMTFETGDLLDVADSSPFVIARLVAQTIGPVETFLQTISRCLAPGGTFLSVEPNDAKRLFYPAWPAFETLLGSLSEQQGDLALDRKAGSTLQQAAPDFGLQLVAARDVIAPSAALGSDGRFWAFMGTVLDLFELAFGVPADYARLRDDLARRAQDPRAYGQAALLLTAYRRAR